ncbi:hypothetical protein EHP00_1782 [Ecytonucleospora hepatopenaei]|uniref:Uncharacterized protein n=1 Tax=Ecytonucleospora hepatopenaei TaxID=646526 RepID=A0A1W0E2Z7_9MICR|nr:hypothetical protein EHP00_1782 [Ecytonucleospora hepatopenaei]
MIILFIQYLISQDTLLSDSFTYEQWDSPRKNIEKVENIKNVEYIKSVNSDYQTNSDCTDEKFNTMYTDEKTNSKLNTIYNNNLNTKFSKLSDLYNTIKNLSQNDNSTGVFNLSNSLIINKNINNFLEKEAFKIRMSSFKELRRTVKRNRRKSYLNTKDKFLSFLYDEIKKLSSCKILHLQNVSLLCNINNILSDYYKNKMYNIVYKYYDKVNNMIEQYNEYIINDISNINTNNTIYDTDTDNDNCFMNFLKNIKNNFIKNDINSDYNSIQSNDKINNYKLIIKKCNTLRNELQYVIDWISIPKKIIEKELIYINQRSLRYMVEKCNIIKENILNTDKNILNDNILNTDKNILNDNITINNNLIRNIDLFNKLKINIEYFYINGIVNKTDELLNFNNNDLNRLNLQSYVYNCNGYIKNIKYLINIIEIIIKRLENKKHQIISKEYYVKYNK